MEGFDEEDIDNMQGVAFGATSVTGQIVQVQADMKEADEERQALKEALESLRKDLQVQITELAASVSKLQTKEE